MQFSKLSHAVYRCDYHLILTTKYRRSIINEGIFAYIETQLRQVTEHYPRLDVTVANHDQDHIHLLVSIPPTTSVGSVVRIIKINTAKSLKQKFPFLKEVYWGTDSIWSASYFVSTVGINKEVIQRYIEQQGKADAGQAKLELG